MHFHAVATSGDGRTILPKRSFPVGKDELPGSASPSKRQASGDPKAAIRR